MGSSGRTIMEKPAGQESLKCPRCDSSNTKFCYYNNYSLSQPRHFCKSCKRYWTRGGTLRNVPVGGGCRKNKRVKRQTQTQTQTPSASDNTPLPPPCSSSSCSTSGLPSQPQIHNHMSPLFYGLPQIHNHLNSGYDHLLGLGFSSGFASNDAHVSSYNSIFGNSSSCSATSLASLLSPSALQQQQKFINGGVVKDDNTFQGLAPLEEVMKVEEPRDQIIGGLSDYSPYYWNAATTAMGAWSDQANNVGPSVTSLI